jgi:hypothetical protein
VNDKRRFHPSAVEPTDGDGGTPLVAATAHALSIGADSRAVVLVEGVSDQVALEALAERLGRNLSADGLCRSKWNYQHGKGKCNRYARKQARDRT